MSNEFTVAHEDVTVRFHPNWAGGHNYCVSLEGCSGPFIYRDSLDEAVAEFRRKVLPETGDAFTGALTGMFTELSAVFREGVIPTRFSAWDQDFPDGPMSVAVKVIKECHLQVTLTWDFGNKPVRSYDMYLRGEDIRVAFLEEAPNVIDKYREAVLLWKDWTEESLGIAVAAMKRLLEKKDAQI